MNTPYTKRSRVYGVVSFINESTESTETCNEVPITWLSDDRKSCKWPKNDNAVNIFINKFYDPQDDWLDFPVKFLGEFGSLKEAQQFVIYNSSTDDESTRGKGFRQKKNRRSYSPVETQTTKKKTVISIPLPPRLSQDNDVVSYSNEMVKIFCPNDNKDAKDLVNEKEKCDLPTDSRDGDNSSSSYDKEPSLVDLDNSSFNNGCDRSEFENHATVTVCQNCKKYEAVLKKMSIDIEEIKETLSVVAARSKQESNLDEINNMLPLRNLNQLEELENFLAQSNRNVNKVFEFCKSVGGSNSKDAVRLLMTRMFADELSILLSWTGQQKNFKIEGLKLTNVMQAAIKDTHKLSEFEYRIFVSEWLRHSRQRLDRKNKKQNLT